MFEHLDPQIIEILEHLIGIPIYFLIAAILIFTIPRIKYRRWKTGFGSDEIILRLICWGCIIFFVSYSTLRLSAVTKEVNLYCIEPQKICSEFSQEYIENKLGNPAEIPFEEISHLDGLGEEIADEVELPR